VGLARGEGPGGVAEEAMVPGRAELPLLTPVLHGP
jgi:hypothetical protein